MKNKKILSSIFISLLSLCLIAVMLPLSTFAADRATDVTEPKAGSVIVRVNVEALTEDKANLIKRINEIRKEACNEGITFKNGSGTSVTLKSTDYKPIEWSAQMEQIALTRAIEANLKLAHSRPNTASLEQNWNTLKFNGYSSHSEILAWGQGYTYKYNTASPSNWDTVKTGDCIAKSIEAWYSEKQNLTKPNSVQGGQTGHYFALINPDYRYIGLAATFNNDTSYKTCAAGELASTRLAAYQPGPMTTSQVKTQGSISQLLEVTASSLAGLKVTGASSLNIDDKSQYKVLADTVSCTSDLGLSSYKNVEVVKGINWSLEDNEDGVLSVDTNGQVTANKAGIAKVVATINGKFFSKKLAILDPNTPAIKDDDGNEIAKNFIGLAKIDNELKYIFNGQLDSKYTGLARENKKRPWYYVSNGKVDYTYTGLARINNTGNWYYVAKGKYNNTYTGLARINNTGNWYYVAKGKYTSSYTGLCKYGNKYYYVQKGKVNFNYTGKMTLAGKVYNIKNGVRV